MRKIIENPYSVGTRQILACAACMVTVARGKKMIDFGGCDREKYDRGSPPPIPKPPGCTTSASWVCRNAPNFRRRVWGPARGPHARDERKRTTNASCVTCGQCFRGFRSSLACGPRAGPHTRRRKLGAFRQTELALAVQPGGFGMVGGDPQSYFSRPHPPKSIIFFHGQQ